MNQLLTIEDLRNIDSESMYEVYDKWPDMAKNCYKNPLPKTDLKNIISKRKNISGLKFNEPKLMGILNILSNIISINFPISQLLNILI